jgi:hypothetical protein
MKCNQMLIRKNTLYKGEALIETPLQNSLRFFQSPQQARDLIPLFCNVSFCNTKLVLTFKNPHMTPKR